LWSPFHPREVWLFVPFPKLRLGTSFILQMTRSILTRLLQYPRSLCIYFSLKYMNLMIHRFQLFRHCCYYNWRSVRANISLDISFFRKYRQIKQQNLNRYANSPNLYTAPLVFPLRDCNASCYHGCKMI
jgi:hypothetical protein